MIVASSNYRRLQPSEASTVAAGLTNAWKDESIPSLQYETAVKAELEAYRRGDAPSAPFAAFLKCLRKLPLSILASNARLLDIGASGGYYSEIISRAGFHFQYRGLDFSSAFHEFAEQLYPGIRFDIGDARQLPYPDASFPIVLHGSVILHCLEYEKAIWEAARVSSRYVLFHRTPVIDRATEFYEKEAYGRPCLEIWFNEYELLNLFNDNGLDVIHEEEISAGDRHRVVTYLLRKP